MNQYSQAGALDLTQFLGLGAARDAAVSFDPLGREVLLVDDAQGSLTQYSQAGIINLTQLRS